MENQANLHMQHVSDQEAHKKHMKSLCDQYHHHMLQIESFDGKVYDGIMDGYDNDQMYLLVPIGDQAEASPRQYAYGNYGYPYYGYGSYYSYPYYGYGYPRRFRRFRRTGFPFYGIRRMFFPWFY